MIDAQEINSRANQLLNILGQMAAEREVALTIATLLLAKFCIATDVPREFAISNLADALTNLKKDLPPQPSIIIPN